MQLQRLLRGRSRPQEKAGRLAWCTLRNSGRVFVSVLQFLEVVVILPPLTPAFIKDDVLRTPSYLQV